MYFLVIQYYNQWIVLCSLFFLNTIFEVTLQDFIWYVLHFRSKVLWMVCIWPAKSLKMSRSQFEFIEEKNFMEMIRVFLVHQIGFWKNVNEW